jgi:hypothetical protein
MAVTITQGSGTSISTLLKAGSHNQDVMCHSIRKRVTLNPTLTGPYSPSKWMGPELSVSAALRSGGDSGVLEGIVVCLDSGQIPFEFDIVILAAELSTPPTDGSSPVLAGGEAAKFQGLLKVRTADWETVVGGVIMATIKPNVGIIFGASGESALRAAMLSRDNITMTNPTGLSLTFLIRQD